MHKSAIAIWNRAFENGGLILSVYKTLGNVSEPCLASLLYERKCYVSSCVHVLQGPTLIKVQLAL